MGKGSFQGDPRDFSKIKEYQPKSAAVGEEAMDAFVMVSVLLSLTAFVIKHKLLVWGSVFAVISALVNMKSTEADFRNFMMAAMFAAIGVFTCYFQPPKMAAPTA